MPDRILQTAEAEVEKLTQEKTRLEADLMNVLQQLRDRHIFIELYRRYTEGDSRPQPGQLPLGNLAGMTIADAAEAILRAHRRPMKLTEIIELLRHGGKLRGESRSEYGTVFKSLDHQPERFAKVGPGIWKLRDGEETSQSNGRQHELIRAPAGPQWIVADVEGEIERAD